MLELLVSPKRAEKDPWILFLIGLLYSALSFFIVKLLFSTDPVLKRNSGLLIVFLSALFSIILVYFLMRREGKESLRSNEKNKASNEWKVLYLLILLFLGFLVGFTILQIIFPNQIEFNSQMETYCVMKSPTNYLNCFNEYNLTSTLSGIDTAPKGHFYSILGNNISVSLTILIFTILFGAGVTFILVWNASMIASVIALSIKYKLSGLPLGLSRFLVHGIPEIMAYFVFALAGGMLSIALRDFLKRSLSKERFIKILKKCTYLLGLGLIILIIAALIELNITPHLF